MIIVSHKKDMSTKFILELENCWECPYQRATYVRTIGELLQIDCANTPKSSLVLNIKGVKDYSNLFPKECPLKRVA